MRLPPALRELAARLHERLLGTGMGDRTAGVLQGLAWMAPAALAGRVLTGVATLLTARWLGSESWGRVNLALAASLWVQVPLLFGLPFAMMQAIPRREGAEREAWARTGGALLCITGGLTLAAGLVFRGPLAAANGVGVPEFLGGLAWCAGYLVYSSAMASVSGLERFRARAAAELAFALAFPAGVVALKLLGLLTWQGYLGAMACAYASTGIAMLVLGKAPVPGLGAGSPERARALLSYGAVAALAFVAAALLHAVGRQVTHRYASIEDVGVLSAYQGGSVQMALYLQGLFSMVFLPVASRTPDRKQLFRKIARLLPALTLGAAAALSLVLLLWMLLLGREYPLTLGAFAIFSLAAGATMSFSTMQMLLASGGRAGMGAATLTQLVAGLVNVAGCFLLIPRMGFAGAGVALLLGTLCGIACGFLPPVKRWAGAG